MIDVGDHLGPYRIVSFLGAGGMGSVYRARDSRLDRDVAIKVLNNSVAGDSAAAARFEREAKAVAALSHPNIVSIFDFGTDRGLTYSVTELLEGEPLRARLRKGELPWREACSIGAAVAEALAAAHSKGIVHRDIKPENIFISEDGRVKLLDFGLARVEPPLLDASDDMDTARHDTKAGMIVGTVGYMSPEQVRGEVPEAASDLFSLGCVLYEMLSGRRPFERNTSIEVLAAILEAPPEPVENIIADVPHDIAQVTMHCLDKTATSRFQSARDVAFVLRAALDLRSGEMPASGSLRNILRTPAAPTLPIAIPETHYAQSGNVNIAYQVVGSGPMDLVFVMGWITHLEYFWREPSFARFLTRLASFSRLILFDKRGTGLSDRVPLDQLPTLEQRMDDVRAVMDAVGSRRAALCGISEGGPMCSLFAATYPEKTSALVMIGTYAKRLWDPEYPWAPTVEARQKFFELMQREWGGPVGIADRAPSKANDPAFREWWATYLRMGASPGAAVALTRMNSEVDIRNVLPTIRVPTLVMHRTGDACLRVEEGRFVASKIPGVKYVEFAGKDHLPFVGNQDEMLDEMEEFLTGVRHSSAPDRVLATLLKLRVTSPDSPRAFIEQRALVERELEWFRGRELESSGNELVVSFDGPARAVRCAAAITALLRRLDVGVSSGAHTGECDLADETLRGLPLDLAAAIAGHAAVGEILVSSTVRDLVAGSGIQFEPRGNVAFGEAGEWPLFRVL